MYHWWQTSALYQIYPRSFQDSNDDGIGDLDGIRLRLDYIVWLGIDAIWISPIYSSPMHDFGYDVADYYEIDPIFGSLETFDRLIDEAAVIFMISCLRRPRGRGGLVRMLSCLERTGGRYWPASMLNEK